ncbi:threonine-phosphate decarboxylase CobD [Methylobacillus caricis]|uniref:threonine-phosphate decarboxylase CobD n=1 Tax=Methylobacillus caricis TaxID=1971611 RepID=UPI001D0009A8|nr:threonine-phosphate decarboxylase CobD [Methylobacillus caricis]MCB5188226.1 threonine-phosphate decarboxylase CobD [Methylobacillus caricis]
MLEHGGNLRTAARHYGIALEDWIDLSTGINPQGYPVPDIPAVTWQRLPEIDLALEQAARAYYNTPNLLPTSGSQAAIQALPRLRPESRVTVLGPMYTEHAWAWQRQGHHVRQLEALPGPSILDNTDVLLVCNPNNPSGRVIPADTLLAWHQQLAKHDGWLIVDEAFMDCTPRFSIAKEVGKPGLIVLRSLGKFFGLAGARVGFMLAEPALLAACEEILGPWSVSGPARFVAEAALSDTPWQEETRTRLLDDSDRLGKLLTHYDMPPSGSTPLFHWVPTENACCIHQQLAKLGIWTRLFSDQSALRFGLPAGQDWQRVETAFQHL